MPEVRRSSRVASKSAVKEEELKEPPKKKVQSKSVKEIEVGDQVPDIKLLDEDENEIDLKSEAENSKYLVIFAYPKASTPGCTRQVCGFQTNLDSLTGLNAKVFGLSSDLPKAQKNFVNKQGLKYKLLSDPSKKLIEVLGAKKLPSGIKRSHWIFEDGVLKVKKIAISPEVSFQSALSDIQNFKSDMKEETTEVEPSHELKADVTNTKEKPAEAEASHDQKDDTSATNTATEEKKD